MEPNHSEDAILEQEAHEAKAAEATPPPPEAWHTPLTTVTPLSKTLAAILFIVLPIIGFWKGYQYGAVQRGQEAPLVAIEGELDKQTESTTKHTEPKEVLVKYSSEELGIRFEYPSDWTVTTNEAGVRVTGPRFPDSEICREADMFCEPVLNINVKRDANPQSLSIVEWFQKESGLPMLSDSYEEVEINGRSAVAVNTAEGLGNPQIYLIANGSDVLYATYAESTVAGGAEQPLEDYRKIVSSIDFSVSKEIGKSDIQIETMQESNDGSVKLRAIKQSATTTVFITNGDQRESEVFSFVESLPYEDSGNHWESLSPNVSLSHDGEKIAFCDTEGIKMYDLATSETTVLRRHDVIQSDFIFDAYVPIWSPADEYLLYELSQYEGMRYGVLNIETGEYDDDVIKGFAYQIGWVTYDDVDYLVYASEGDGYAADSGLYVSRAEDLLEDEVSFIDLTKDITHQYGVNVNSYEFDQETGEVHFEYFVDYNAKNMQHGVVVINQDL